MKLTREQLGQLPDAIKRRNPDLYSLGPVAPKESQHNPAAALGGERKKPASSQSGVRICVTLVTLRRKLLDDDNAVYSLKPIRDAVADRIGLDDGDKRIRWQYQQVQVDAQDEEGVLIKITLIRQ